MKDDSIGNYQLGTKLGEGGMGAVYRARDQRLNRDVAIKLLPPDLAADPERLSRFDREARVLAALNHPNVAAIYGLEDYKGQPALVMELVEGESLQARLSRGPVSLSRALEIAGQIAEGVEAAHERGIVHRDLKPANVQLTSEGRVKVLDFGLAKSTEDARTDSDLGSSPTMATATAAGVILGTAAYMSPEQARGKVVDRRTDIWSFGVVLFEMLTGSPAFAGDTLSDLLVAVLSASPDLDHLPAETPPALRDLVERCLRKDPRQRLRDLGDARILLQELQEGKLSVHPPAPQETVVATQSSFWTRMAPMGWGLAALLLVALVASLWNRPENNPVAEQLRFTLPTPGWDIPLNQRDSVMVDISPDGNQVVYTSRSAGSAKLFLQRLDEVDRKELPETDGGYSPFFSPDGEWVGFFQQGRLKKISTRESVVFDLAAASWSRGATWTQDGKILYSPGYQTPIMELDEDGGQPRAVSTIDEGTQERTHRWPAVLPGDEYVLFTIGFADSPSHYEDAHLVAVSRRTGERKLILERAAMARYIDTGHLVFLRSSTVWSVAFDVDSLEIQGTPRPLSEPVGSDPSSGAAHFAVAKNGTLVYLPSRGLDARRELVLVNRDGSVDPLPLEPAEYQGGRFSPDGKRIAYQVGSGGGQDDKLFIYDLETGFNSRFTFGSADMNAVWMSTGDRLFYNAIRGIGSEILIRPADGSEEEAHFDTFTEVNLLTDVGPGDDELLATVLSPTIGVMRVKRTPDGTIQRETIGAGEGYQWGGQYSPDFKWIAYASNESGRHEIYVEPSQGTGRWQVSTEGGMGPVWGPDGREIFFVDYQGVHVVDIQTEPRFRGGRPRRLFGGAFRLEAPPTTTIDISPDGQRFLMTRLTEGSVGAFELHVTTRWTERLK